MTGIDMSRVNGKYALMRLEFLKENAEELLGNMIDSESIYEHLNTIQDMANEYVSLSIDKVKHSKEYLEAEENYDGLTSMQIVNTALHMAEYKACEEWIYVLPDYIDDEDAEEYTDPYIELYMRIQETKQELMQLSDRDLEDE